MPKFKPRKPYQRNKKAFAYNFELYDAKHRRQIQQRAQRVTQLYNQVVAKLCQSAERDIATADPADEFRWQDYPALARECNALLKDLDNDLTANLRGTVDDAWQLANTKNDGFIKELAKRTAIPAAAMEQWNAKNLDALDKLNKRIEKGMNLSDGTNNPFGGVWNLGQFKQELELSLQVCMGQGMSAQDMSREVRGYLKYPDKLFRRVRDEYGVLRLSKAAQAFHPGVGVYRSSYKNALRLTATENNIAYRTADHERWKTMNFIIGQQVILSNNHPITDICDTLSAEYQGQEDRGRYPKDFKFTGWHPWCRCYVVPILPSDEELDAYLVKVDAGEDTSGVHFADEVEKMPDEFNTWVEQNQKRIEDAAERGKLPYFLKDNPKQMTDAIKLAEQQEERTAKATVIIETAKETSHGEQLRQDIEKIVTLAKQEGNSVQDLAEEIAQKHNAVCTPINFKSPESIERKVMSERKEVPNFSPLDLKDAVRTTIVAPRTGIAGIIEDLQNSGRCLRWKPQNTEMGYTGNIVNITTKSGIVAEIQVNTARMIYAKESPENAKRVIGEKLWNEIHNETGLDGGLGHKFYEAYRVLDPNSEEAKKILKKSQEYYKHFQD